MQGENNLINAVNRGFIERIERKDTRKAVSTLFAELLAFAGFNMIQFHPAVYYSEKALYDLVEGFAEKFSWDDMQKKQAYYLAFKEVTRMAVEAKFLPGPCY